MIRAVLTRAVVLVPVLGLGLLAVGGCASSPSQGYAFDSTYDSGVRSVAVPVFENKTYAVGVEVELTEAIIKEIQRSTPMVVTRAGRADSELRGVIRSAQIRSLANDSITGLTQTMSYKLSVDFEWIDARTGKPIVARKSFASADVFVPAQPTGERIETGRHATAQRLARDIVAELRETW
ncbi:MAG: hypothetical protein HUU18_09115 [Phycisphaerales bacterium]|nr:hypothetical protein [Phycisphaerales bacterium]